MDEEYKDDEYNDDEYHYEYESNDDDNEEI